ncbi:SET domain-containing protein [Plenodomus tracheiphilus IPT5]|uniref:SET domain-containing protein n=1 Tax=Plenodomus tracheiphilus IPT5 TaxID=1408161 RepID=A0A6A7BFP5_9PLEO|nr:SET domain-containing protein [Plenodomus tracheiphilus IPT5]
MHSIVSTHQSRTSQAKQPSGVSKPARKDPRRPARVLRSFNEYFWYTSTDGVDRLATSSSTLSEVPRQINDHIFNASLFAHIPYPTSFPPGSTWPPQTAQDVLYSDGSRYNDCVGEHCYTDDTCKDAYCGHTFDNWKGVTQDWQDYFELRKTADRGIGVFTKRAFKKGDVLGWYAGEIIPSDSGCIGNAYLMELPIGNFKKDEDDTDSGYASSCTSSSTDSELTDTTPTTEKTVMIDGEKQGNWTRFINHSCAPYCNFRVRRVGTMRIMTVEATRIVPAGVELTVSYGNLYYRPDSYNNCSCRAKNCVSRGKVVERKEMWPKEKKRVKKCRRLAPP